MQQLMQTNRLKLFSIFIEKLYELKVAKSKNNVTSTIQIIVFPFPQGSMFGGIALFENICFMVGSVAGGAIYSETVAFLPGFAFWVMAGYNVIALFLLM